MGNNAPTFRLSEHVQLRGPLSRLFLASDCGTSPENTGIGFRLQLLAFFIAAALVVSRRPDALFHPQFFGEDGSIWYPEAYMSGWFTSLLHSSNGYFQTLPRLIASVALLVPLRFAPLLENLIGLTLQVLPVNLLLSARARNLGPLFLRILMAGLYLALPNTSELDVAPEEGQWHLALLACILVLACRPSNLKWQVADVSTLLLSGLSGPFSVILLPISLVLWWFRRERWRVIVSATIAGAAIIQLSALGTLAEATRSHAILGATPKLFIQLLAGQVYLAAMLGQSDLQLHKPVFVLVIAALGGTAVMAYCFLKARLEWKLLLAFCILVFAASLKNPMVSKTVPQWEILRDASSGIRYWFFPTLAFVWALAWCATRSGNGFFRFVGVAGLLMACAGIVNDWRYPAYRDFHFAQYAAQFASAPTGTMVTIPILPEPWKMQLVKKGPGCDRLPIGNVDRPAAAAHVSGFVRLAGWVVTSQPVRKVLIYIDRGFVQAVTPDVLRPDMDKYYPHSPDKYKGWETTIDVSKLRPGAHEIEVRALEADGCEADIGLLPVERTAAVEAATASTEK
jgi:hypothetical protein